MRVIVVCAALTVLTALAIAIVRVPLPPELAEQLGTLHSTYIEPLYVPFVAEIIAAIATAIFIFNINAVGRFLRRSIAPTDELIIGPWNVYRYTKSQGKNELLYDVWTIRRNFARQYVVVIETKNSRRNQTYVGTLEYNERDRFSVKLTGVNHKQQSFISFSPRISINDDTRTIGFGVGDDADYVLSARIYVASREPLHDSHVEKLIDDVTKTIASGTDGKLIQLSSHNITEVLLRHPWPETKTSGKQDYGAGVVSIERDFKGAV